VKKKLSILIYSLASGGAERVVSILLYELKDKYNITLFLMNDTIFYEIPKEIKVVYLENSDPRESGIKKLLKLPLLAWRYKKLNSAEVSLSFMNRPNYISTLAKIFGMRSKVVISERAMPSLQHKSSLQGFINRTLIKYLYKSADVITANSKGNTHDLQNSFGCKNVVTINNPFDLEKIETYSREEVDFRDEKFTFITVGRVDSGKNHKLLVEAIKDIDAKLYIIGDGELRSAIEEQIRELNLNNKVILLGRQSNPYKYLAKADCFVFSSLYEGFPNVLLEALASGLPVISSDCKSGPREILAPESDVKFQLKDEIEFAEYGILVALNSVEKLKEAMNKMMASEDLRNRYKEKAQQRARDFDVKKIIKQYEDVINA
jgi:N-acetylgalactosamine-N,N'-diacetylbacillosaminyl-diphospho-undecaprenol 4-alpha-N-acetylgalactosaminyltransferase